MADNPFSNLPTDPNTGVPVISIGPGSSITPTSGGGDVKQTTPQEVAPSPDDNAPQQTAQAAPQRGPRYDPNVVDDQGLPVDQWAQNPQAPAKAQPQPQQPAANPPDQSPSADQSPASPSAPVDNDELDKAQHNAVVASMAQDKRMGSFMDIARTFNQDTLRALQPVINTITKGAAGEGFAEAGQAASASGAPDVAQTIKTMGEKFMSDPNATMVDAGQMFDALGIKHEDVPSYMGDAGHAVWNTIATSLAMAYGASSLASGQISRGVGEYGIPTARVVSRATGMAIRKYSQAIAANPNMWMASELMGGVGATVGGEKGQDYTRGRNAIQQVGGNLLGSMAGGLVGGGSAFLSLKAGGLVTKVSKATARALAEAVSEVKHLFGGESIGAIPRIGRKGPSPVVDPDVLNNAREKETLARDAGDQVVKARQHRDGQVPWTAQHIEANLRLGEAKAAERDANQAADSAWNMIPAEVRGPWSRQQHAIRAKFADTEYPKQFAEKQVEGEKAAINNSVHEVFERLKPENPRKGVAGYSAEVSKGLWKSRALAKGILDKYWARTPLHEPMPNRSTVLKALDGYLEAQKRNGFNEDQIPIKEINQFRDAFGDIKKPAPKLNFVKHFMTMLHERANKAYLAGDNIFGSNYDRFHSMLYGVVSQAFPDNVPLQQAREVSKAYFDLFTRSEIGKVFKGTRAGGSTIHEEDVLPTLLNRARGLRDLATAVKWLDKSKRIPKQGNAYPTVLTPAQRQELKTLQDQATQGIKAHVTQYIGDNESDPNKAQRLLGDPTFQASIEAFGKVAGEVRQASKELSQAITRKDTLKNSALSKYAQRDSDKALDMVWSNSNPSAMAKMLIDGTAGVGGFSTDPIAMQGFKAGLLDRFYNTSKGDPVAMQRLLESSKGRLLKSVLSPGEYDRFTSLINRIEQVQADVAKQGKQNKIKTFLAQYVALKFSHYLPHVGEGGELKKASLISGMAKDITESFIGSVHPQKMFSEALENPAFEALLYSQVPQDRSAASELAKSIRRVTIGERAILGFFDNWMTYGDGPQAHDQADQTDQPFSWLTGISSAKAGEVVPLPLYPGQDMARRQSMDDMKARITADNPNKSPETINGAFDQHFGKGGKGATLHLGPGAEP